MKQGSLKLVVKYLWGFTLGEVKKKKVEVLFTSNNVI